MKINLFYSKQIKCMFKASNNHFIHRSKIKIPKIRPFYNLKSAKITKKRGKIFSASILEDTTCTKHLKNYTKWKRRSNVLTSLFFFLFFKNATYLIFVPIKLKKGVIFDISRLDLSSIWLFDTFNIPFLYIG